MLGHRGAILALALLLGSCGAPGARAPRLVLLLSVDTLRADHLGAFGGPADLTPNLDALARSSLRFANAYAPASHTLPSVSTLLTGLYPEELGVWSNESVLPSATTTLASSLRTAGWNTAAVVSNWILRRGAGLSGGFDHYDDELHEIEAARPLPERIAGETTDAALRALDACLPDRAARCFLWVHYQDPHGPYTPPAGERERFLARESAAPGGARELPVLPGPFGPGGIPSYQVVGARRDVGFYRAGYDGEIAYLDRELGRLLAAVRERGLEDDAVIAFTADHGESLGEDDTWFAHGEFLSDAQVRVPLLIRAPGAAPGDRRDVVSLVDLRPTLEALALGAAPRGGAGRALLAEGAETRNSTPYLAALRGAKLPRFGIVDGDFKYLLTLRDGVWDGRLVRRGHEDVDLTAAAPQVAARLRRELEAVHDRYHRAPESRAEPDAAERARLEALGYAAPGAP